MPRQDRSNLKPKKLAILRRKSNKCLKKSHLNPMKIQKMSIILTLKMRSCEVCMLSKWNNAIGNKLILYQKMLKFNPQTSKDSVNSIRFWLTLSAKLLRGKMQSTKELFLLRRLRLTKFIAFASEATPVEKWYSARVNAFNGSTLDAWAFPTLSSNRWLESATSMFVRFAQF